MQKKLKEIKPGEIFGFGGYEWIKLEDGFAITKDKVTDKEFNASCNNDFMQSEILPYLTGEFANKFWKNGATLTNFDYFPLDLTADDGTKKYEPHNVQLGLLTADLYRKNRHLLEPINNDWWLATPKSYVSDYVDTVLFVDSDGIIWDEYAEDMRGVRPLCKLSDDTLVEVLDEDKTSEETGKEDITELIKKWAIDRNVVSGDVKSQMVKLLEEAGELATGINKDKRELIIDSIGDVYVVLVILCMQLGLDINDCIKAAYGEIKDRKGKLVNGLFVKEKDLEG
jgi:hypothetical protein|nr:MAG TPA: NTP-PPase-like protein [Caudoviricetes sp.]